MIGGQAVHPFDVFENNLMKRLTTFEHRYYESYLSSELPKHDLTHDTIVLESIFAYLTPEFTLFRLLDVSRGNS